MHDVQVLAAPAVAAAAIATARDAEAIATAIRASEAPGTRTSLDAEQSEPERMATEHLDRAAAVVTACCSRLLMAAVDSAANDAESMPSRVVVNALGSIAANTPESVLHAMARSSAGRARLDDLRRSSPHWASQIQAMVASGVLRARRAAAPQRRPGRRAATPYAALPTAEAGGAALPIPGGVPGLVPDWGRAATASTAVPGAGRYEFEMTASRARGTTAPPAPAASGVQATTLAPATEPADYAEVLRQFQADTAAAVAESEAMAKAEAARATVVEPPISAAALPIPAAATLSAEPVRFPVASAPPESSDSESVADGVFGRSVGAQSAPERAAAPRVAPVGNAGQAALVLPSAEQAAASAAATRRAEQQRHRKTWAALRGIRGSAGRAASGTEEEAASLTGRVSASAAAASVSAGVPLATSPAESEGLLSDEESLFLLFPEAPTAVTLPARTEQPARTAGRAKAEGRAAATASGDDSAMLMFAM
jgi:hypothetical protein